MTEQHLRRKDKHNDKLSTEPTNPNEINRLGVCYAKGKGVLKNTEKAEKFFKEASELGNSNAVINLAICYGTVHAKYRS